jgi:hypothetical protein
MWEPVGPLPATVYWRRRWVAIASVITVIVLFAWGGGALTPQGSGASDVAASRVAVSAPQQPLVAGPPPTTSTVPSTTGSPAPAIAPQTSAPVPCTEDMLAVAAEVDRPEHRVGERVLLQLVVTNTSDQPCVRDVGPSRQEIVVWSGDGKERLWSSNDCSAAKGDDLRTLAPGEPVVSPVRWVGRTSAPGCPEMRETVPAGAYRVTTRLDDMTSRPTPFTRRP